MPGRKPADEATATALTVLVLAGARLDTQAVECELRAIAQAGVR
jgi:hypothetical protein